MYIINNRDQLEFYKNIISKKLELAEKVIAGEQPNFIFDGVRGAKTVREICAMIDSIVDFYESIAHY